MFSVDRPGFAGGNGIPKRQSVYIVFCQPECSQLSGGGKASHCGDLLSEKSVEGGDRHTVKTGATVLSLNEDDDKGQKRSLVWDPP